MILYANQHLLHTSVRGGGSDNFQVTSALLRMSCASLQYANNLSICLSLANLDFHSHKRTSAQNCLGSWPTMVSRLIESPSPTCLTSRESSYLGRRTGTDYIGLNPERLELHICVVRCIALQQFPCVTRSIHSPASTSRMTWAYGCAKPMSNSEDGHPATDVR